MRFNFQVFDMENSSYSFESVWATLQEIGARIEQSRAEADSRRAEADRRRAEIDKEFKALAIQIKATQKELGGIGRNNGAVAEEFFYNSLKYKKRNMFGQKFDKIIKEEKRQTKEGYEDEYDIMLFNGKSVCIVEVKYKADSNDVQQVLRKEKTFRANFPEHNDKKLYLALASMTFHKLTEKACADNGIAIIKQAGNAVVINDEHLKVF